jgi:hypothetical protein
MHMPPDFSEAFANHLKAADVPPKRDFPMTITSADVQAFAKFGAGPNEPKQRKLVVGFAETSKTLVCNATNARTLADAFGTSTEALLGKKVSLSQYSTNMGAAIRVTVPAQQVATRIGDPFAGGTETSAPPLVDPHSADFDDDIPF